MVYLMLILAVLIALYLGCRLYLLRKSMRKAEKELKEITSDLEENRVVKIAAPCRELESLLEAVNQNLADIRAERQTYRQKELQLKEQVENISHDLRTPLTAILGYLKMLDADSLSREDREYLEVAVRKSETLNNLISRFYELSRVTSEDFKLKLTTVDSARILREACLEHYEAFEKAHLEVRMEAPETPVFLMGDRESLERVFGNLLQNSVRYARSRMEVCLQQNKEDRSVVIAFKNDIDPQTEAEEPSRLFDRFYMQEQSRSRGGTGLGLTISKHLVEHMHGEIRAEYCNEEELTEKYQAEPEEEHKAEINRKFLVITITFPGVF
ncbi:MAG: HAMP domain-containing sensor histidine kinase [Eubacteriales bacterium]|nr:HAMP domain-containing sensor histidine kinase [Eubacteriales bacterium]